MPVSMNTLLWVLLLALVASIAVAIGNAANQIASALREANALREKEASVESLSGVEYELNLLRVAAERITAVIEAVAPCELIDVDVKMPLLSIRDFWSPSRPKMTVVKWYYKVGDHVAADEPLCSVSGGSESGEVITPLPGELIGILVEPGVSVEPGTVIGRVRGEHFARFHL